VSVVLDCYALPDAAVLDALVEQVHLCSKLSLFGLDGRAYLSHLTLSLPAVIREEQTGRLFVVDLNYFPSYSGVDQFPQMLTRCVCRVSVCLAYPPRLFQRVAGAK
jgi:hypothetical protein